MGNKKSKSFKSSQLNIGPSSQQPPSSTKRKFLFPLDVDFELAEYEFRRLDDLIRNAEQLLRLSFDSFSLNLSKYVDELELDLPRIIREQRTALVERLMNSDQMFFFRASSVCIGEFLFDAYYAKLHPDWSIFEKLKYYELFDRLESVDLSPAIENNDCYNYIVVPMSRRRFFVCLGLFFKKSYLKITDNFGRELRRREIDKACYYRQFIAYGKFIVGLYEVIGKQTNLIEIYDDELRRLNSKQFDHKVELVLMNSREIICKSCVNRNLFFFLDFTLNQIFSLSIQHKQLNDADMSTTDGGGVDCDLVLLGSSRTDVFVLVKSENSIKRVRRRSGQIDGVVSLSSVISGRVSTIRLEPSSSILVVKSNETNCVVAFDFDMTERQQVNNAQLVKKFVYLDFTSTNDIYYCDILNKRVHFA